ncbi:MAG: hypothetical protein ABSD52_06570 [Candidatus Cybelea sp.]
MRISGFGRCALSSCAAAAMLAGCGGSSRGPATLPQSLAVREANQHGKSASGDLIYVSAEGGHSYVLSYPEGKLVGTINQTASGACADASGNVYLPGPGGVLVYSHGATSPSATLTLSNAGLGCAVDPVTGNLAVTTEGNNGVAVFKNASGQPTIYQTQSPPYYCGYDNQGNLFVDGTSHDGLWLDELPKNGDAFLQLSLNQTITLNPGQIQWDGNYLTVQVGTDAKRPLNALAIDRLTISGSAVNVISQTTFKNVNHGTRASWIYGNRVLMPLGLHGAVPNIGLWAYPKGGKAEKVINKVAGSTATFTGVTISVAP